MAATHGALVTKISCRPHPNSDNGLQLGQIGAFQVVVGKDTQDGDTVLFFSSELRLTEAYLDACDLRPRIEADGTKAGGYFPSNGAVRAQKFRGEKSDGYVAPLSSLQLVGIKTVPKLGEIFTGLDGIEICEKKVSKNLHTRSGSAKAGKHNPWFLKHFDTEQFGYYGSMIKDGSLIHFSTKLHGTSGRTGLMPVEVPYKIGFFQRWRNKRKGLSTPVITEWKLFTGSRNVVIGDGREVPEEFGDNNWRIGISKAHFEGKLFRGETVFYEIVGYLPNGQPIMAEHNFTKYNDKELKKLGIVTYDYGQPVGHSKIYVYRITQTTEDIFGNPISVELSVPQVRLRCAQIGVDYVPGTSAGEGFRSDGPMYYTDLLREGLQSLVNDRADGPEIMTPGKHPREGVVLRIEERDGRTYFLKHKGLTFKIGEGIAQEAEDSFDMEEAS